MIPEIIEAYRSKTQLKKTYANKLRAAETIIADFDFSNSNGDFICYLGGHSHITTSFTIEQLENRDPNFLPQQMLLCTNQAPSEVGKIYNRVLRKDKSLTSNSFNIYAIDTQERKIYITFFGAWKPEMQQDYEEIQSISY